MTALDGRRVLVTRTRERAAGLVDLLHQRGAEAVVVPLIATEPLAAPADVVAARDAARSAAPPRWAVFTSATAVRLALGVLGPKGLEGIAVAAVGGETASALASQEVSVDVVAAEQDAAGLASALAARRVGGATVWFPSAEGAGTELADALRAAGAVVSVQPVYRTTMPVDAPRRLRAALDSGVDAVILTSGSTARNLASALGDRRLAERTAIVCIGRQTAAAAHAVGFRVTAVAAQPNAGGLVDALERALHEVSGGGQAESKRLVG